MGWPLFLFRALVNKPIYSLLLAMGSSPKVASRLIQRRSFLYQTSTGPWGTGIAVRDAEAGSMKAEIMGEG